ncbi:MAG: exonuclease, partial [Clostridiales bacterium]|nr:exonuclease [Clostridiales bacterium]
GKICVFTGTLEKMVRKEAMQAVVDFGGTCGDNVTSKTNYLILGNFDYCKSIKDGKSRKHKKAEKLILQGQDISIISENVFYDLLEN